MSLSAAERQDYEAFVKKFERKKTSDDCYTPAPIYEAIRRYLLECGAIHEADTIVRPFYPGGDYEHHHYPAGSIVVDNPPFSILSKIVKFYVARRQPFFLFAPSLTCTHFVKEEGVTIVLCNANTIYDNGANVRTSFLSYGLAPFQPYALITAPELAAAVEAASKEVKHAKVVTLPVYVYPDNVTSAAILGKIAASPFSLKRSECRFVSKIDANKYDIYGGGLLISSAAAARAAAAAAARTAARVKVFELSERERAIIAEMDKQK